MVNQLNCLRCSAGMCFLGRDKLQRRPNLLLSDLTFALAGGMEIDIYSCPKCGKIELFVCGAVIDFDYGRCPHCKHEF